ncbi:MAG: FGGY-family carbohydrate kinase [Bacteroidota bacterium]
MSLLGIDIGTTGCKAVAFDREGKQIASSSTEYPLLFPRAGWIELDPEEVWKKTVRAVRSVAEATRRDPVTALAVSAQGEAFMPVDRTGRVLHNSIVTFDGRAEPLVSWWDRRMGRRRIFAITGIPLSAMATLPKIQWLRKFKPGLTRRTARYLCFQDFFALRAGVEPCIDFSLAARTMGFDVSRLMWSDRILHTAGLDQALLARPVPSGTVIGELDSRAAAALGLSRGVRVVAGGHDQPCGALGAGVTGHDEAMYATGTVECIVPTFTRPLTSAGLMRNNLCVYPHIVPGKYVSLAFNFTGGSLLRWYRDTFGGSYDGLVSASGDVPSRLLVLPHFTMTGTPYFDTRSGGVIAGLQLSTARGEITAALLEGVTMEMRLNVELLAAGGIRIRRFRAIGGGAKSPRWMQIKADIMNRPVVVPEVTEAACLGAAIMAGVGTGIYRSAEEAVRATVRTARTFRPRPSRVRRYDRLFLRYRELFPAMQNILHQLAHTEP